jgi:ribosomal protein L14E/L6E/L27E
VLCSACGLAPAAAMPFKRNAEIGRVAVVNYGEETGKLVVISDIVDQNRVSSESWNIQLQAFPLAGQQACAPAATLQQQPSHPWKSIPQACSPLSWAVCWVQALVDRPDEVRRVMNFKRLALTDIKLDIPRLAKKKVLSEALSTSGGSHWLLLRQVAEILGPSNTTHSLSRRQRGWAGCLAGKSLGHLGSGSGT